MRQWKLSPMDLESYARWYAYSRARDMMLEATDTKDAPWYVIPADNKWFTRLAVASAIIEALNGLNLAFPDVDKAKKKELEAVRASLLAQKD